MPEINMPLGKTVQWAKEGRQLFEGKKPQNINATLRDKTGYMAIYDKNKVYPRRNSSSVQSADRDLTWAERITQILFFTNFYQEKKSKDCISKNILRIMFLIAHTSLTRGRRE